MSIDLSIFISCYNEATSIIPTLNEVLRALKKTTLAWEILVIDDCSRDDSVATVNRFIKNNPQYNIRLHVHKKNCGLDPTIFEAANLAQGRYFWCVAGDNPVPSEACFNLLSQVGKADLIIPYVEDYVGRTNFRRVVSWLYAALVRGVSGCPIRYYNGSSIFLREQFIEQMQKIKGFTYSAELLIGLWDMGFTYIEVPVVYTERTDGKSTALSFSHLLDAFWFFSRMIKRRLKNIFFNPNPKARED